MAGSTTTPAITTPRPSETRGRAGRSVLRTPIYELRAYKQLVRTWRERFTASGRRAFVALVALAVLGVDTRRNQTFLLFAVAAGLHVSALALARLGRPRARLALALPPRATAGEPIPIRGRVRVEAAGSALLRATFGHRALRARLSIEPAEVFVTADEPGERDISFTLDPKRRGRHEIGPVTLRPVDPLGFVAGDALATIPAQVVLVAPPMFAWELRGGALGRRLHPGGIPLATASSDSMELIGTREWRPGDRLRNVHWRSFARRGAPIVKEFQEEYFPRIAVVVDTHLAPVSASREAQTAAREAFEAALSVAASITAALAERDHVVELVAAGPEVYRVSTGRGLGPLESVLDVLACLEPSEAAPLADVAPAVEQELAQIGTVYAVLLDWDEGRAAFLARMRALGTEVHAVIVREAAPSLALARALDDGVERMTPSAVAAATRGGARS
jgi:uncharacterized protein (DUF58 family)